MSTSVSNAFRKVSSDPRSTSSAFGSTGLWMAYPRSGSRARPSVYPIVEEVVVTQLVLREELRITRRQRTEAFVQDVTLRRVRAEIERTPSPPHPEAVPQAKG